MLIVISNSDHFLNEKYYIEKFLNEGVDYFHLRKPALSEKELSDYVNDLPKYLLPKISLHNHYSLLDKFDIGGIHFTSRTKHLIKEFNNSDLRKSVSCHSFEEIKDLPKFIDYTFLSPVFDSISKENYSGKFSDQLTKEFLRSSFEFDIVALGGVTEKNISQISNLGFNGAAVLGAIWNDPENTLLLKKMKKYV